MGRSVCHAASPYVSRQVRRRLGPVVVWLGVILIGVQVPALAASQCLSRLWPPTTQHLVWPAPSRSEPHEAVDARRLLLDVAQQAMRHDAAPLARLRSAGVSDPHDAQLLATRRALRDAERSLALALAFVVTQQPRYLRAARRRLLAWAAVHQPTGHPIDESRLEGLVWAYDLLRCHLTGAQRQRMEAWLHRLAEAKRAWSFGPLSAHNNHKTHQLKLLLLLDKVLAQAHHYEADLAAARAHLAINIPPGDGRSRDFQERDALYYHVYTLEAWLEIALLTGCCRTALDRAFAFLQRHLLQGPSHREFGRSTAAIDRRRGRNGFAYVQADTTYDPQRATRAIMSYYTLRPQQRQAALWSLAMQSSRLRFVVFAFYRSVVWPKA